MGDAASRSKSVRRRIILISDLQQGSRLDALGEFEWPSDLELELKTVATEGSNAGIHWLAGQDAGEPAVEGSNDLRVRVSNDAASKGIVRAGLDRRQEPTDSRLRPPRRKPRCPDCPACRFRAKRMLRLQGDTQDFDNSLYVASESRQSATVLYVGRDASDDPRASSII